MKVLTACSSKGKAGDGRLSGAQGQRHRSWAERRFQEQRGSGGWLVGVQDYTYLVRHLVGSVAGLLTERCKRERGREYERKSGGGGKERRAGLGLLVLQVSEAVYKWSLVGDVVVLWAKSVSWGWGGRVGRKSGKPAGPGRLGRQRVG